MKKSLFLFAIILSCFLVKAQTVPVTNTITMSAATSSDPDGTIVSYSWLQTSGTITPISGANTPTATITYTTAGSFAYSMTVTDNSGGQTTALITVKVDAANKLPTAIITINGVAVSTYEIKLPGN